MATYIHYYCILLFLRLTTPCVSLSDQDLLLRVKISITDPTSSLSSWAPTTPICNWTGISCSSTSPPTVFALNLHSLNLSGEISPSICSLPSLSHLNLAHNSFNTPIPLHISQCTSLLSLNLSSNSLWGTLPDQLSLLSSLTVLDLASNSIEGQLPPALGSLASLQVLNLGSNLFSGTLHHSLFKNLTELVLLDLSDNPSLTSSLPSEVGGLGKLKRMHLQSSGFVSTIPESFLGLDQLEVMDLSRNSLTGSLSLTFGFGLPKLVSLDLSQNKLSGPFPSNVCYGDALVELSLYDNIFTGSVPKSIEKCSSLERFEVHNNRFSGEFPSGLWSLPKLSLIRAESNGFTGDIPELATVPSSLEQVRIDDNKFSGKIPHCIGRIHTMYRFSASLNGFYGNLPANFFDSPALSIVNLSHNSLSGSIPELVYCKRLVSLSLAGNRLAGHIPNSLAILPVLTYIDLSSNNLTGEIPQELQNLKLALFNVSYNQLSGSVPPYLVAGLPASFLQGNPDLCGPGLPNACNGRGKGRGSKANGLIIAAIAIAFAVGSLMLALGLFVVYRLSQKKSTSDGSNSVLFYPLRITGDELMFALDDKCIIGRGPFGNVYRIQLPDGQFVVVKRISNSGSLSYRTLKAEIKNLGTARHKNLVKLLGFYYQDDDVLLIYECFQTGSLRDAFLRSEVTLEWGTRWNIALGAARGLAYLHNDHLPHLLHRNLMSSNILLDEVFEAKITDFGLDHVVGEASFQSTMASELTSCCYTAPEHKCSKKATEQMDVYSFGVVLLELITGRLAEEQETREALDVVKWVRRKINVTNGSLQVLDPKISSSYLQEMFGALDLALRCTSVIPERRPLIDEVVRSLEGLCSVDNYPMVHPDELSISN